MDDRELLREYVERQSEPAFAELVARHVNLVYATALRVLGDAQAAQDVVQAVFIQLARQAWAVRDGNALVGWLYRAAYRTALDAIRGEQRRRQRETEAMILTEQNSDPAAWEKFAPLLDEAMQGLNRTEQNALLLRYFDGKTMRETGDALGTTEAAAQMRVTRALEKMRTHFARNGVTVATGILVSILAANTSHAAPVGLATRASSAAKAGLEAGGIGGLAMRIFFMSTKTKIITAGAIVLAILAWLTLWQLPMNQVSATPTTKSVNFTPSKISPPVALAVPTPEKTVLFADVTPPAAKPKVPVELTTAIDDVARLLQEGNVYAVRMDYGLPDRVEELRARLSEEGQLVTYEETFSAMTSSDTRINAARVYQAIKNLVPVMNEAGDEATYDVTLPPGVPHDNSNLGPNTRMSPTAIARQAERDAMPVRDTVIFQKIDGKWYLKYGPDALF